MPEHQPWEGTSPRAVVLGIGNLLLTDEGFGPAFVAYLQENWELPAGVRAVDGGTGGLQLLSDFQQAELLIIVDIVRAGGDPGDVYRFTPDEVPLHASLRQSAHQVSAVEAWHMARLLGEAPDAVIVGVEPADYQTPHVGLSQALSARLPVVAEVVIEELTRYGFPAPVARGRNG
ncbi:MAG: HyaD/HybD family hydrogenase maturation endopeptidase [Thermoleophilia bacterium]